MRLPLLTAALLASAPAWADGHGVTVRNATPETIRLIQIGATPGGGENRLRSQLPRGATGRIAYSTGCLATVRLGYESGRTEDHPNVDVCSDPLIVAGTDGVAGPVVAVSAGLAPSQAASSASPGTSPIKPVARKVELAPAPVVPPWTGKSITKKFGGLE